MSEHDIVLGSDAQCEQLFCLFGEVQRADLIAQPDATHLVGLGFSSNIKADDWQRAPVNLVAVVDKSGSMDGEPIDLVRKSLKAVVEQLGPKDQVSIILYGSTTHVHLSPTMASDENKPAIQQAISAIESMGSTAMEAGLKLGYETAQVTEDSFDGTTRIMLFTDERPNVGATDPDSFMGMAGAGSNRGIGLTTVGVGVQFGAELATKISSVRGGNLFFIADQSDIDTSFGEELHFMVSELAHDLTLTITPSPDFRIAGIYGIPGEVLGWQPGGAVTVTIPTVFASNRAGAIFVAFAPGTEHSFLPEPKLQAGDQIGQVSLEYVTADAGATEQFATALDVKQGGVSDGMKLGHMLVDEFTALHLAATEHHQNNDQEKAYQLVRALGTKFRQTGEKNLDGEKDLVFQIEDQLAFLSGHASEASGNYNFAQLWGNWEIYRVKGKINLRKGDLIEFQDDNWVDISRNNPRDADEFESEMYRSNNRQVYLEDSDLTLSYRVSPNRLKLMYPKEQITVYLRPAPAGD